MDLGQGEAFGFLGFDFWRVRSLRGWVTYFRIGNAARCCASVTNRVEKKVGAS